MSASSLVGRLALLQQTLAAAIILLFAACALAVSASTLRRQESAFLHATAWQMARSIALELREEGDLPHAAQSALEEGGPVGVHIRVLDRDGREILSRPRSDRLERGTWREARLALDGGGWLVASVPTEPR